jgi:signal transduction histidine kinase
MASNSGNMAGASGDERLALLAALGRRLAGCSDLEELRRTIIDEASRAVAADGGVLALCRDGQATLEAGPVVGTGEALAEGGVLASAPVTRTVLRQHETLHLENPSVNGLTALAGWSSLLASPLMAGDQLLGAVLVGRRADSRHFTPGDQSLLAAVASTAAVALAGANDFERFSHDVRAQIVDATRELSHAMAELSRVKSFNENIFESIAMGIVVFDRSFAMVFRNRQAEDCFPGDRQILDALSRTDIAERWEHYQDIVRDVVRMGQVCAFDHLHYVRGEKDELVLRVAVSPLFSGREAIVGGILTIEDLTRSVDIRQRLDASERLAAVGRLASKVAHELNNPLDGILRYISLASRVAESHEDQRPVAYLKEARTGLLRMARIISELLQFSRSTTHVAEDGQLRTALEDAVKSLAGQAECRRIALSLSVADDVPPLETTSLYQVVTNLVKNAIEAVADGGCVDVRALMAAGAVEIHVADNGPGIAEDKLEMIFEPFFSTKQAGQGTGLGLAISKELVEKQGGKLVARNRPEGGAEFVVRIPTQWTSGRGRTDA